MAYQTREDCDCVILHVLAGADQSIVGLSINNCTVRSMTFKEFSDLAIKTRGIEERNHLKVSLLEHQLSVHDEAMLVVLEVAEQLGQPQIHETELLNALRLYKAEDIYSVYFISYRLKDGELVNGGNCRMIKYKHAIDHFPPRYSFNPEEKDVFCSWFAEYRSKLHPKNQNNNYKSMLNAYNASFLIGVVELEYIMLFSVLEMIFPSGHSEITYQISRGTALLLSTSAEEMESVYKQMKKLYNARSKYVHEGKRIPWDSLCELRCIVSSVLIKLIDFGYHSKETNFDNLRTHMLLGGFKSFSLSTEECVDG